MKKKITLTIMFVAVFVVAGLWLLSPNEKGRIRHDIKSLKTAVEQKKIDIALKYISRDYRDAHHGDFEEVAYSVRQLIGNFDSIRIVISGLNVDIDSVGALGAIFASCSMGLKIMARYEGDRTIVFGGVVKPAPVRAYWKKTGDNYQVYHAWY